MPKPGDARTFAPSLGETGGTDFISVRGVSYPRHNTRPRMELTALARATRLASYLEEAAFLTTSKQRALYLKIRALWAECERDRRDLRQKSEEDRAASERPLF